MLLVRVSFDAGPNPGTQSGQLTITTAESDAITVPLLLDTFVPPVQSVVETKLSADNFSIFAGRSAQLLVTARSVSGPATDVIFEKSEIFLDAKVSMQPVTLHVESGQTTTAPLIFQADPDATVGTFDLAIQQFTPNKLPFFDLRVTVLPAPQIDLQAIAQQKIDAKYAQIGGFASPLGMPMNLGLEARQTPLVVAHPGGHFTSDFRGGTITIQDLVSGPPVAQSEKQVKIFLAAIECRQRQESEDEIYGSVGAIKPSTHSAVTSHFPAKDFLNFGPDGERIALTPIVVYDDAPADVLLVCELVEHDSGDIEKYKQQVASLISQAANAAGAAAGIPSEAVGANSGFINTISLGLANAIFSVLGADDDPFNSQTLRISARDILSHNFTTHTLSRTPHLRYSDCGL